MEEGVPCKTPAAKLTPPVKKSQDMHDERSKLVNEYACRVLELLGMGHRLFVPRLLAVRSCFLQINSLRICHLSSQSCFPPRSLVTEGRRERLLIFRSQFLIIHLLSSEPFFFMLAWEHWTLVLLMGIGATP